MKKSTVLKISILACVIMISMIYAQQDRRHKMWQQRLKDRLLTISDMNALLDELETQTQQALEFRQDRQQLTEEQQNAQRQKQFQLYRRQQELIESLKLNMDKLIGQRELKAEFDESVRQLKILRDGAMKENAVKTAALIDAMIENEKSDFEKRSGRRADDSAASETLSRRNEQRNQFIPDETWPDNNGVHINAHGGGILLHDGVYYWFGEHKTAGPGGNVANVGVHCYSSTDLYNWNDEGIALSVTDDPNSDIVAGCVLERPKVIYNKNTKNFVMWFHLELKGQGYRAARTGVANSNNVIGPYNFITSLRPNAGQWPENLAAEHYTGPKGTEGLETKSKAWFEAVENGAYVRRDFEGGQMSRDMTLFVDDDGRAYHIHAAEENYTLHISELSEDYLSFSGRYVTVTPGGHNEAPAIFKHDGKYYLLTSGCTGWAPNAARSMVASSIWGPWENIGNPTVGINPHNFMGPELTFGGQSTFILPVNGKNDAFIAMFDIWRPQNAIDGGYIWLPIKFTDNGFQIEWMNEWDLSVFE